MASSSICPDCKAFVAAGRDRCPGCGRAAAMPRRGAWLWLWTPVGIACLLVAVVVAGALAPAPESVQVGRRCVVGAKGAWFALDDAAWEEVLDALHANDRVGLDELAAKGRAFYEPPRSTALVVRLGVGSVLARVVTGENVGAKGWVQRERVGPFTEPGSP